jgi:hypothetical protein
MLLHQRAFRYQFPIMNLLGLLRNVAMDDRLNMELDTETTSQVSQDSTSSDSDPGNAGPHRLRRDKSVSFPDQLTGGGVSTNQSLTMVISDHNDDDEDDGSLPGGVALSVDAPQDGASDSHSIAAPDDPYDSDSYNALAGSGFLVKAAGLDAEDDGADVMDDGESSSNGDKTSEAGEISPTRREGSDASEALPIDLTLAMFIVNPPADRH